MLKYVKIAKNYALHPALTIGGTAITIALIIGACVKADHKQAEFAVGLCAERGGAYISSQTDKGDYFCYDSNGAPIAELKSEFIRYRAKLKYQSAE